MKEKPYCAMIPVETTPAGTHFKTEELIVDEFASVMKGRMREASLKGRSCWHDKTQCSQQHLSDLLRQAVNEGGPIDVANYAMMLHWRGETVLPTFYPSADED